MTMVTPYWADFPQGIGKRQPLTRNKLNIPSLTMDWHVPQLWHLECFNRVTQSPR